MNKYLPGMDTVCLEVSCLLMILEFFSCDLRLICLTPKSRDGKLCVENFKAVQFLHYYYTKCNLLTGKIINIFERFFLDINSLYERLILC